MYTLMLENNPVMEFDLEELSSHVVNSDLLPFFLRGIIEEPSKGKAKDYYKTSSANILAIKDYASSRVLSLSRDNAKQIYAACGISQDNSIDNRVAICLKCKGISVNDAYWFKEENSKDTWDSVNVRTNSLSTIVDVALGGKQPTITTPPNCPELTTKGLFKKAWTRENSELYLLKSDRMSDFSNTRAELLASQILDCTNVPHVSYKKAEYEGMLIAKSKNFVLPGQSFVEAHEVMKYCKDLHVDYSSAMLNTFGSTFANIAIVDYLIQNTDRHDQNYGFLMDNNTGHIVSVAPLFDHNQSLIADWMEKDVTDTLSQMFSDGSTIAEVAKRMEPYADLSIDKNKFDFLKEQYPEQSSLFERIEQRMSDFQCIHIERYQDLDSDIEL